MKLSIILNTDSYKASQFKQYPPGTEYIYSYVEARSGKVPYTVVFGPQAFIKEYLLKPISLDDINEAEEVLLAHGEPFNREGWEYILEEHNGFLPLEIKCIPEGTKIGIKNVIATLVNTDPKCAWLTSYVETAFLRAIWYPTTVATNSHYLKELIKTNWLKTSETNIDSLDFKLHDFGPRGVSSLESSEIGGAGHLINFLGTDNVASLMWLRRNYNINMAGFSIPATEHSTMTSWGKDNESAAYKNMIEAFPDSPLIAIVSDSYDMDNAVLNIYGNELKDTIIESGRTLVVRPDSGIPHEIVPRTINQLIEKFGYSTNSKGYKVLPECVRVIQGDGITPDTLPLILDAMVEHKLSIDNIAFGMGGGLLQHCNRDDFGFAMKCSAAKVNGEWRDVFKSPKTDMKKASKKGQFVLIKEDSIYKTVQKTEDSKLDEMKTIYRNGKLLNETSFDSIRLRSQI